MRMKEGDEQRRWKLILEISYSLLARRDILSFLSWSSVRPTYSLLVGLLFVGLLPGLLLREGPGLLGDRGLLGLDFAVPGMSLKHLRTDHYRQNNKNFELTWPPSSPCSGPRCNQSCLAPPSPPQTPSPLTWAWKIKRDSFKNISIKNTELEVDNYLSIWSFWYLLIWVRTSASDPSLTSRPDTRLNNSWGAITWSGGQLLDTTFKWTVKRGGAIFIIYLQPLLAEEVVDVCAVSEQEIQTWKKSKYL